MKKVLCSFVVLLALSNQAHAETRCGWLLSNSLGGYMYLTDAAGSWLLWERAGHEATFDVDFPKSEHEYVTPDGQRVSCVCMNVETSTNRSEKYINVVRSIINKPLMACDQDKKIERPF